MHVKQVIISELENLSPNQLYLIHSLIKSWKHSITNTKTNLEEQKQIGKQSRVILSNIKDSLGDDMIQSREDKTY